MNQQPRSIHIFCLLILIWSHSLAFSQAPTLPDFIYGQWELKKQTREELWTWEGKISKSPIQFYFSKLPFFPTVEPNSEDLFKGFFRVMSNNVAILWNETDFSPQSAFKYTPQSFSSPALKQELCYDVFPVLRNGKRERFIILVGLWKQHPFYFTWTLPLGLENDLAVKQVLKLFKNL
jgi:hypothetical protein